MTENSSLISEDISASEGAHAEPPALCEALKPLPLAPLPLLEQPQPPKPRPPSARSQLLTEASLSRKRGLGKRRYVGSSTEEEFDEPTSSLQPTVQELPVVREIEEEAPRSPEQKRCKKETAEEVTAWFKSKRQKTRDSQLEATKR